MCACWNWQVRVPHNPKARYGFSLWHVHLRLELEKQQVAFWVVLNNQQLLRSNAFHIKRYNYFKVIKIELIRCHQLYRKQECKTWPYKMFWAFHKSNFMKSILKDILFLETDMWQFVHNFWAVKKFWVTCCGTTNCSTAFVDGAKKQC